MDREDRRRYFVVGSVIIEVVTPLLQQRIQDDQTFRAFGTLQDYLNNRQIKHILFHLRHNNIWCCSDSNNCVHSGSLPLNYRQWSILYSKTGGPCRHNCHCKYTANAVQLVDPDISLSCIILLNCCNLTSKEYNTIHNLRQLKNNFLSHNTEGAITADEYKSVWTDLTSYVLQLDKTKEDNLKRIKSRPLDEALCHKYNAILLDIHQKLDEIGASIQGVDETIQRIDTTTNEIDRRVQRIDQTVTGTNTAVMGLQATMEEFLYIAKRGITCQCSTDKCQQQVKKFKESIQPYKLGQSIFTLHHQTVLTSVVGGSFTEVTDIVMMDDGRLVICLPHQSRLLICNTDGSQVDSIHVQGLPWYVTAVNKSTVAVTLWDSDCIEMYDINNKLKLKSISPPGMWWFESGITTINNKLVVGGDNRLLIVDHQTGEMVQTIQTKCQPYRLHGSGDRIFYINNNKLYWYSYTDDRHHTLTLPSRPRSMTTLQDGSLYVRCKDGSEQHVSSDGKQYKPVKTLQSSRESGVIHYNLKQRKLVIIQNNLIKVFNEL
ncbi:uncharacterized protein LOC127736700 [Mytilus californianus]|uniref:uncharacterized protein LOC127736700 n=1 Tax=Mytilus californianus TaxID=6549 RepID=UPI00224623B2|nr:uncharacterized protein LOC127736700 [Mytilus californianus]